MRAGVIPKGRGSEAMGKGGVGDHGTEGRGWGEGEGEDEDELLVYNVFVMTATAEEMEKEMPHLLVRLPGEGAGASARRDGAEGGNGDVGKREAGKREGKWVKPNTVDFSQREKDEMRDLTKASEIIAVWGVRVLAFLVRFISVSYACACVVLYMAPFAS
jgi:dual specificity MAP kinase phosphatase